jgi:cell division protein FtsB
MPHLRKETARLLLYFLLCTGLIVYFSYHAVHGKHGLHAKAELQSRVEALENELRALKAETQRYDLRTARMNSASRDEDLIEEQARAVLNFAHPDDILLVRPRSR